MIKESKWKYFFLILILADIAYTYIQNSNTMMLDGDMAGIILPADAYKKVMTDPFGLSVLLNGEYYAAPNRFFIHLFMQKYFQFTPFFLQQFNDPVDSIFLSIVIARTAMHVSILYLISTIVSGRRNILDINLLAAALIITPLFQVNGYHSIMAVTINSITYSFFYTLPLIFILLYFYPFINYYHGNPFKAGILKNLLLILLAFIIAFGGPLGPPIILVITVLFAGNFMIDQMRCENYNSIRSFIFKSIEVFKSIPLQIRMHFIFITILCVYSLYLGTHNTENEWNTVSILKRYELIWMGIWRILTLKIGVSLLLGVCLINIFLITKIRNEIATRTLKFIRLLGAFSLMYIFLLPIGGYREYRPLILRFDTFSPVTIVLILVFGLTSLILLSHYRGKMRLAIVFIIVAMASVYMNADRYDPQVNNCQRDNLRILAKSTKQVVELHGWCTLLTWEKIRDPNSSQNSAELIRKLGITKEKKLYFHQD